MALSYADYSAMWTNVHALFKHNPEVFELDRLVGLMSAMQVLSLLKRLLDPFGLAAMPFPAGVLSLEQINTAMTEAQFRALYAWFHRCPRTPDFDLDAATIFVEEHFALDHFL